MSNNNPLSTLGTPGALCAGALVYLVVLLGIGSSRFWLVSATLIVISLVLYRVAVRMVADQYTEEVLSERDPDFSLLSMPGCRVILTGAAEESLDQLKRHFRDAFERSVVPAKSIRCYCLEIDAVDVLNRMHCLLEMLFELLRRNPSKPAAGILFVKLDVRGDSRIYGLRHVRAELISEKNLGLMEARLAPIEGFEVVVQSKKDRIDSDERIVDVAVHRGRSVWLQPQQYRIPDTPENREYFSFDRDLHNVLQSNNPAGVLDNLSQIQTKAEHTRRSPWLARSLPWLRARIPDVQHYPREDLVSYLQQYSRDEHRLRQEIAALRQRLFDGPVLMTTVRDILETRLLSEVHERHVGEYQVTEKNLPHAVLVGQ
jgi:hypothetical protein